MRLALPEQVVIVRAFRTEIAQSCGLQACHDFDLTTELDVTDLMTGRSFVILYACRDGCHHCGSRMGRVIGDHIPPNKFVNSPDSAIREIAANLGITSYTHIPPFGKLRCGGFE